MKSEVIILGAGPGGLATAYWLLKNGVNAIIIEKELEVGGLMRSVKYKDFTVDYGFKNLDDRIPEVHKFWKELLKDDYSPLEIRTGILYKGHILEQERLYKGLRRGMPYNLLIPSVLDMLISKFQYQSNKGTSLANYSYSRRGKKFTRIFSQEYSERSRGSKWLNLLAPIERTKNGLLSNFIKDAVKPIHKHGTSYHPVKGTGQIMDYLKREIVKLGGQIYLGYQVTKISHKQNKVINVSIRKKDIKFNFSPSKIVSSLPLQSIAPLIGFDFSPTKSELSFKRGVIMVYLFLKKQVKFPHHCIHVSCPNTRMSRITNYGAFGGSMVPNGKACLCVEYFIPHAYDLYDNDNKSIFELAIKEYENSGLLNRNDCTKSIVIRNSFADAAVSWADYQTDHTRIKIQDYLSNFTNLYQINRTGADKSTYAGIMAAKGILNNDRHIFESLTKPDHPSPWENKTVIKP